MYFPDFPRHFQEILEISGFFRNNPESSGISWKNPDFSGISQNCPNCSGNVWNFQDCSGIFQNFRGPPHRAYSWGHDGPDDTPYGVSGSILSKWTCSLSIIYLYIYKIEAKKVLGNATTHRVLVLSS